MATLRRLPVDIAVYAGLFGAFPAAQPLVFAHLGDVAPDLDLDHVEVVPAAGGDARLAAHFDAATVTRIRAAACDADTLVLLLPNAFDGPEPAQIASPRLRSLGSRRGQVRRAFPVRGDA
jgi:hypothetical protein